MSLTAIILASAVAEITGGTSVQIGTDLEARFFHEASALPDGRIMITGGMQIVFTPTPSLVSLDAVTLLDPETGATTDVIDVGNGPVTPLLTLGPVTRVQLGR